METWKSLNAITGGLSAPSKMPAYSWSIPAQACGIGAILRNRPGSTCASCYALKGRYVFPNVRAALERRLAAWSRDRAAWRDAMAASIRKAGKDVFRWFDSGDLQGPDMLADIIRIARATPNVRHWLPTREYALARRARILPPNLTLRVSAPMIGSSAPFPVSSTVDGPGSPCPAPSQGNKCGDCRKCWDRSVPTVSYHVH